MTSKRHLEGNSIQMIKDFCEQLAQRFPDMQLLLANHLADYDEILPHVFMGDVTRYILADGAARPDVVIELERGLRDESRDVQELVAVSFVENLADESDLERALEDVNAQSLRAEWHRQHSG